MRMSGRLSELCKGFFAEFTLSGVRFFPFTELALSIIRSFAPLRVTKREGFRVRMAGSEGLRKTEYEGLRMETECH